MNPLQLAGSTLDEKIMADLSRGNNRAYTAESTYKAKPVIAPTKEELIRNSINRAKWEKERRERERAEREYVSNLPLSEKYLYYSGMSEKALDLISIGLEAIPFAGQIAQAIPDAIKIAGHSIPKALIRRDAESISDLSLDFSALVPLLGIGSTASKYAKRTDIVKDLARQTGREIKQISSGIKATGVSNTVKQVSKHIVKEKAKEEAENFVEEKAKEYADQLIANNIQEKNLAGAAEIMSGALIRGGIQGVKSKGSKKEAARAAAGYIGEKVREDLISRIDTKNK